MNPAGKPGTIRNLKIEAAVASNLEEPVQERRGVETKLLRWQREPPVCPALGSFPGRSGE